MKMPLSEIADKATILMVRKEKGVPHDGLEDYLKEAEQIDEDLIQELYEVNWQMWELEDEITQADNWDAGWTYKNKLRLLTKKRSEIKNKIAEKYGGYQEVKKYD